MDRPSESAAKPPRQTFGDKLRGWTGSLDDVDLVFSEEDLETSASQFLGDYTQNDFDRGLDAFGFRRALEARGYHKLKLKKDTRDPFVHRLIVTDETIEHKPEGHNFLLDMFFRRKDSSLAELKAYKFECPADAKQCVAQLGKKPFKLTVVEWCRLQDVNQSFTEDSQQLPGQNHPGLHIAREVLNMFVTLGGRKGRDAIISYPEHFYNAVIYYRKGIKFINPYFQAEFENILSDIDQDMKQRGFHAVAWALFKGSRALKKKATGEVLPPWNGDQEMCLPVSDRFQKYFASDAYAKVLKKYRKEGTYCIDWKEAEVFLAPESKERLRSASASSTASDREKQLQAHCDIETQTRRPT